MAFGRALVLLVAALAIAAAQHDPMPDPHDPAYDPFFHPTGRPKQNTLAGATSQQSPGFPEISKLLPLVQADTIGPTLNTATTEVVMAATWDFSNPALVRAQRPPLVRLRWGGVGPPPLSCHSICADLYLRLVRSQLVHASHPQQSLRSKALSLLSLGAIAAPKPGMH